MENLVGIMQPFLCSIIYLSREAKRAGIKELEEILLNAQWQIVRHFVQQLTAAENHPEASEEEYQAISDFLVCLSAMSPESLSEFNRLLDMEDRHLH